MNKAKRRRWFFWWWGMLQQPAQGAVSGPGEPTLAGQPIGLLLALTYSATVIEE